MTDTIGECGFGCYREVVLTEEFCVFWLYIPLEDICSIYTQTLVSKASVIGISYYA